MRCTSVIATVALAISVVGPAKAQSLSAQCPGHDGPIQSFASETANWAYIDFDVATMSNVTVGLRRSNGSNYLVVTFSQIRPQGFLQSHLYAEIDSPREEIKLFGIYGDLNRPDPPRTMTFVSKTPVRSQIDASKRIYLSIDCNPIADPRRPSPPPSGGPWFNLRCDTDGHCWIE
jgi:hypothetical protein